MSLGDRIRDLVRSFLSDGDDSDCEAGRRVVNVITVTRCPNCHRRHKARVLLGIDTDLDITFFSSVKDASSWENGIPVVEFDPGTSFAPVEEESEDG